MNLRTLQNWEKEATVIRYQKMIYLNDQYPQQITGRVHWIYEHWNQRDTKKAKRAIESFSPAKPCGPGGPMGPGGPGGPRGSHSSESAEDLTSATCKRTSWAKIQKPGAEEKSTKVQIGWEMDQPLLKRLCYKFCQLAGWFYNSKKLILFWSLAPWSTTCTNAVIYPDNIRKHFELTYFHVEHNEIKKKKSSNSCYMKSMLLFQSHANLSWTQSLLPSV